MLASLRKSFKIRWGILDDLGTKTRQKSLLLQIFLGILEDIIFWKRKWISITSLLFLNILFFVGSYSDTKLLVYILYLAICVTCANALETWLKYKHRTTSLKQLATRKNNQLDSSLQQLESWLKKQWNDYIYLRHSNHTKAFLMMNIICVVIYVIGRYISGYILLYFATMTIFTSYVIAPLFVQTIRKIPYGTDSEGELDGLIPEVSEKELQELSFEPEQTIDEKQVLENWKPNADLNIDDDSDSSTNSSIATNLSIEKLKSIDRVAETSDSSDDEYIPLVQQKENLQTTVEVTQISDSWGMSAFSALRNLTGAMTSMVYPTNETRRPKTNGGDSSDGFEIIEKSDLL